MELVYSALEFLRGILRRFYFWVPPLLFDPFDLYDAIKPSLPSTWQRDIAMPSDFALAAFVLLFAWAAVCTYHDERRARLRAEDKKPITPNARINRAVKHISAAIGETGEDAENRRYPRTLLDLRQSALDGRISLFGYRQTDNNPTSFSEVMTLIPAKYWAHTALSAFVVSLEDNSDWHEGIVRQPQTRPANRNAEGWEGWPDRTLNHYSDLWVNMNQIKNVWPKKSLCSRIRESSGFS